MLTRMLLKLILKFVKRLTILEQKVCVCVLCIYDSRQERTEKDA